MFCSRTLLGPQWDSISPYIVVFTTTQTLRALKQHRQMHFLYFVTICYLVLNQPPPLIRQFFDSIVSRSLVLMLEEYVFGKIHKADLALTFFYMCLIICLNTLLKPLKNTQQMDICLGVLMYSFSQHLIQTMQSYCNNQLAVTFAVTASLMVLPLYQTRLQSSTADFCVNSFSLLWNGMLESFLFLIYPHWEPLIMYPP